METWRENKVADCARFLPGFCQVFLEIFCLIQLLKRRLERNSRQATQGGHTDMGIYFYKFPVTKQVFYISKYSYALVNLKPIVPGHILIVSKRQVSTIEELEVQENSDFFQTVKFISKVIKKIYKADSLNIAIQDGIAAGQSVPHLHCHIIPRYLKDGFGDGIYENLEYNEGMLRNEWWKKYCKSMEIREDKDRVERDLTVMENEALWLNKYIQENFINDVDFQAVNGSGSGSGSKPGTD